jgi:iron complex transport system substrate-binding protein
MKLRIKSRKILLFLLILVVSGMLSGCGNKKLTYEDGVETWIFTDSYGREVEIPTEITSIVPSGPLAQMMLATVASDELVGLSSAPSSDQMKYFPEEFTELPTLGQFYGRKTSLNLEALLSTDTQLIIDLGERKEGGEDDMDGIQNQTGIATIFIEATLDTYPEAYETLGKILGKEEKAAELAAYCQETIDLADAANAQLTDEMKKTVLYGTSSTGLNCNAAGSIQAAVIDKIGAENVVVADEISGSDGGNPVNLEEVYNLDPDVIVLGAGGPYDTLADDSQWAKLTAVQNGQYYEVPYQPYSWMSGPPSVNQVLGVRWLGNLVYPDLYQYDIREAAKEFYRLFWQYDLSDEEVEEMLAKSTGKTGQW